MKQVVIAAMLSIVLLAFLAVAAHAISKEAAREQFYDQCVVENKELPRPDLFCLSSWELREGR